MGENILKNVFDKDLVSRIYKELSELSNKEITQLKPGQNIWIDFSPNDTGAPTCFICLCLAADVSSDHDLDSWDQAPCLPLH